MKTNWQTKKLDEIGTIFNGNSINEKVKKDKFTNFTEGYPFIATKDIDLDTHDIAYDNGIMIPTHENGFKIAHAQSILICAEGGSAGRKIAFNTRDICFGNKLLAIEVSKDVDPKFVYYWYLTTTFQNAFKNQMAGIIGGISISSFKKLEIMIPLISEQRRIVKILDEAFEKIAKAKENAEKNLQNSKDLFESYLHSVFYDPVESWELQTLEDVISEIRTGPFGSALHKSDYVTNGIPVINPQDIADGKIVYANKTSISKSTRDCLSQYILKENDIVFARRGEMGRCAIVTANEAGWLCGTGSLILRFNDNIDVRFIHQLLQSSWIKAELEKEAIGATMSNLNQGILNSLQIAVPPIEMQRVIIEKLDLLSEQTKKLEVNYKQKIADLEELKKSLLTKAFAGEL